ncbi:MAG: hypothetical protein VW352_04110 [Gammaproteobacteria bacterium]
MLNAIMLGLGFAGGLIYLAAYFSLTRGWISGTSYLFHGTSVISCIMIAASSAYSEAWPSAVMNVVFIVIGAVFMAKKAIADASACPSTVVDASELAFQSDTEELTAAA